MLKNSIDKKECVDCLYVVCNVYRSVDQRIKADDFIKYSSSSSYVYPLAR